MNPSDALENFKLNFNFYALVLTDCRLKDTNGIKFAKEIRRIMGYNIFIVLMTRCFIDHSLRDMELVNVIKGSV